MNGLSRSDWRVPVVNGQVRLAMFEGPIELLLYLVRENELAISDVPIAQLTDDYLTFLRQTEVVDMAAAADFLVMAALLVRLKVRYLLPRLQPEELATPLVTLEGILDQFRKYQRAAALLSRKEAERRQLFPRKGAAPCSRLAENEDLALLAVAFRRVLARLTPTLPIQLGPRPVRIEDKLAWLRQLLVEQHAIEFEQAVTGLTLTEVIVIFIAVLELVRLGEVRVRQDSQFGTIWLDAA